MDLPIETERLVLRRFVPEDLDALAELHGDERVMRYLTGAPSPRAEVERTALPRFLRYDHCRPALGRWAALERASGRFVGWFALTRPAGGGNAEAELGFRLKPEFWNAGLATEGAAAVLRHGFERGIRQVRAHTYQENVASQRVLEKLGLTLQRRYRPTLADLARTMSVDPAPAQVWEGDEFAYALTRSEWERANTAPT